MKSVEFKMIDNKLHYRCLEFYNGSKFSHNNSDGDEVYDYDVVEINGMSEWEEVPSCG